MAKAHVATSRAMSLHIGLNSVSPSKFKGKHARFHAQIVAGMPASQTPNLFLQGPAGAFASQRPFTV
jgi:hypothetical protein